MPRILLVEDDPSISMGLKFCLEQEGFCITNVSDGESALRNAKENYDLILLDLNLPDMHGFEILKRIKNIPIICLTANDSEVSIVQGLDMGAYDYVTKPFKTRELISRMNAVLRREKKQTNLIQLGSLTIDVSLGKVKKNECEIFLTSMEYKILLTLAMSPHVVFTREKILSDIWDVKEEYVNDNTLTVNIKRLREKIEDDPNHPKIIETVRKVGYKIGENL